MELFKKQMKIPITNRKQGSYMTPFINFDSHE